MTCSKVSPVLSRLLDQELSPRESAEVESHLSECGACHAMLQEWRLQGFHLRTHLRRRTLGEDFVRKVMDSEVLRAGRSGRPLRRAAERRNLMHWFPAAAAIFAALLFLSPLVPHRESVGYARVLDPGGSLEVLPPSSSVWMRTTAGELLYPGDWLRNPVSGAAEILWRDCCRLTIESGTLTHIPDAQPEAPDAVVLLNGSLMTEISAGKRDFQVRTPAGAVAAAGGRFAVRARDWTLPQLEVSGDRSEIMTGAVLTVGEVSVGDGKVRVCAAQTFYEVRAGETASFTAAMFGKNAARPGPIEAAVSASAAPINKGGLSVSLTSAQDGLRIRLTADKVSLKRLLESATGIGVSGGEEWSVTGMLSFPAGATPESVAAAVGEALGLPIAFRQEKIKKAAALAQPIRVPAQDRAQGSFRLEKSPEGRISFEFHDMPAGEAVRILRTYAPDVPDLTLESKPVAISTKASGLSSAEVGAWIEKTLGLRFISVDLQADVIEVESYIPIPPAGREEVSLPSQASRMLAFSRPDNQRAATDPGIGAAVSSGSFRQSPPGIEKIGIAPVTRPIQPVGGAVWSVLDRAVRTPGTGTIPLLGPNSREQTGKIRAKTQEYFSDGSAANLLQASGRLIWPAFGAQEADEMGAAYLVRNTMGLPAHTVWNGYNCDGQLIAQYAMVVFPSATLALQPARDLPAAFGRGGHWETLSDIPVAASGDMNESGGSAVGLPVEAERLSSRWSFPAAWLTKFGGRLWIVNPGRELTDVEMILLREGRTVFSERLILPPHGSLIWPDPSSGINPAAAGSTSGMFARIEVRQGAVAAGLAR